MTTPSLKRLLLDLLRQGYHEEEAFVQGLSEAELATAGTPERWSVKDNIVHITFWLQQHNRELTATLQGQELTDSEEDEQQLNTQAFEKHRFDAWPSVHAAFQQTFSTLISLLEQFSEEDMTTPGRFPVLSGHWPMYAVLLGRCYEHNLEHLAQCFLERQDLQGAIKVRENCVNRILQAEVPDWIKGSFLYNLACFYTEQHLLEKALALLQEALVLDPDLQERSQHDPDLVALRAE